MIDSHTFSDSQYISVVRTFFNHELDTFWIFNIIIIMDPKLDLQLRVDHDAKVLNQIHALLETVTTITSHIEAQNETIIQENQALREENQNLEMQLKLLIEKNAEINSEVEILIDQNKEFRESLNQMQLENGHLKAELKYQNRRLRSVIEQLKAENSRLKSEIREGVNLLRWSGPPLGPPEKRSRKKKKFWQNCI